MDLGFRGKVAMVAASSRGLGFGIAQALAREGAAVSIAAREESGVRRAAQQLETETAAAVLGSVLDASNPASITQWVALTEQWKGRIDCLVINAGGPPAGKFDDFTDDQWRSAFELTLMSAVRMIRAVLPAMRRQGGGSILAITSSSIKEPIDNLLLSNVMRAGVAGLVKTLSRELAMQGIRINNIVPGRIDTDRVRELDGLAAGRQGIAPEGQRSAMEMLIPLGRYGTIEEFGRAAAFLLSEAAGYVTGATFVVDGGALRSW